MPYESTKDPKKRKVEPLTGQDYMTRDLVDLQGYPDFSPHALRIIRAISKMKTHEIEKINLIKEIK